MPISMTGFGHHEISEDGIIIRVDIKALNSRYLDLNFKLPRILSEFEPQLSNLIKDYLIRGRIIIHVEYEADDSSDNGLILNENLLKQFVNTATKAGKILNTSKLPDIDFFLNQTDIIKTDLDIDKEQIENCLEKTVIFALQETQKMRKIEGENLTKDLKNRLSHISDCIENIDIHTNQNRATLIQKYRDRINKLIDNSEIDEMRFNQEIAILVERRDISEEIVRFKSHAKLFGSYLKNKEGQIGKKMNFLLQEMGREVNTIGSKTDLSKVSHIVVDMKDDLEKLREQVQNIL